MAVVAIILTKPDDTVDLVDQLVEVFELAGVAMVVVAAVAMAGEPMVPMDNNSVTATVTVTAIQTEIPEKHLTKLPQRKITSNVLFPSFIKNKYVF